MSSTVHRLAERYWQGDLALIGHDSVSPLHNPRCVATEITRKVAFCLTFGNVTAFRTEQGLVLVDTGSAVFAPSLWAALEDVWRQGQGGSGGDGGGGGGGGKETTSESPLRIHSVIYTHHHLDHIMGMPYLDQLMAERGYPRPTVYAHANLLPHLTRYAQTAGYNQHINNKQFRLTKSSSSSSANNWPTNYRLPDVVYSGEAMQLRVGEVVFHLFHALGETDDATWVYEASSKCLVSGDLMMWACCNCGNPQKVQRFPVHWARALRAMQAVGEVRVLLPGHGPPVFGEERVQQVLDDTATLLEGMCAQFFQALNAGLPLADVLRCVRADEELLKRPYLRPVYDDPEFIVRNLWRLYAGWYDQDPAALKPAHPRAMGAAVSAMAGGAQELARKAKDALRTDKRVAAQLAQWAVAVEPENRGVLQVHAEVFRHLQKGESSLMAQSIYRAAAMDSEDKLQSKL